MDISPADIESLSKSDQAKILDFLKTERQRARIQEQIHSLAETCFKKCITASISQGKMDSREGGCMRNCVDRFMDSNMAVLRHLETLRAQQ